MDRFMFVLTIVFCSVFAVGGSWVGYLFLCDVLDANLPIWPRVTAAIVTAVFGWTVYVSISSVIKVIKGRTLE